MRTIHVLVLYVLAVALVCCGPQGVARAQNPAASSEQQIFLPLEEIPAPTVTSHHLDIENYASGEVKVRREINLLSDESAVNHGEFAEFYKNGEKFAEGRYNNGLREGEWNYWFDNGQLCKTVQYQAGVPHGEWTVFRDDGTRRATRHYVNGGPQGTWQLYAEDGETVLTEEQYEDGLASGKWVRRFPSGKPHIEENYQGGKRHGKFTEWDEEGQILREMNFKEGQLDGRALVRAPGGREIIQHYKDGQLLPDGPDASGQ